MYDVRNTRKLQFPLLAHIQHQRPLAAIAASLELFD
jgi:hypothetical protein